MSGLHSRGANRAASTEYFFEKSTSSKKVFPINNDKMDCCGIFTNSTQTTSREDSNYAEDSSLLEENTKVSNTGNKNQVSRKPTSTNAELFGVAGSLTSATEEGRRLSELRRNRILQHEAPPGGSVPAAKPAAMLFSSTKTPSYSVLSTYGSNSKADNIFAAVEDKQS